MPDIAVLVQKLAAFPGIDGCALVESDTGMVWHYAGTWPDIEKIGEAAVEFWRLKRRLSAQLQNLGSLNSAAYAFSQQVVGLFPCSDSLGLILVFVGKKRKVDWSAWDTELKGLQTALTQLAPAACAQGVDWPGD